MSKTGTKRTRKTPRQRAEEAIGIVDRRIEHATRKLVKAKSAAVNAELDLDAAKARRAFLIQDPALPSSYRVTVSQTDQPGDSNVIDNDESESSGD